MPRAMPAGVAASHGVELAELRDTWLIGDPAAVTARLRQYLDVGISHFIFALGYPFDLATTAAVPGRGTAFTVLTGREGCMVEILTACRRTSIPDGAPRQGGRQTRRRGNFVRRRRATTRRSRCDKRIKVRSAPSSPLLPPVRSRICPSAVVRSSPRPRPAWDRDDSHRPMPAATAGPLPRWATPARGLMAAERARRSAGGCARPPQGRTS